MQLNEVPTIAAFIIFLLAIITFWFSIKLMLYVEGNKFKIGWWTVFPAVMLYAVVLRGVIFFTLAFNLPLEMTEIARALMILFWIGMVIFTSNMYYAASEVRKK